jgi:hypothetical protein
LRAVRIGRRLAGDSPEQMGACWETGLPDDGDILQSAGPLVALAAVSEGPLEKSTPAAAGAGGPKRKRHRGGRALLIVLALLVVFHRPLLIGLVHAVAVGAAARENIQLSLQIEGTIFTNLSLRNVRAVPSGNGPTPVENISIDEVTVQYSIPSLLRNGVSEFLKSYLLRNAYIVLKPVAGTSEQKSDLASTLHGLIQQPALFSNHVELDNFNLVADVPDGEFAVQGLTLFLDPVLPGSLDIALLQIPRVRTWHDLKATGSYANRDLILNGLEIDPQIIVQRFELDASQRAQGVNRMDVQGEVFGGSAQFSLLVRELPGKHENNVSNALAQVDAGVSDVSLEKVSQYFGVKAPAIGSVSDASVHLTGDPNTPSSWTGDLTTEIGTVRAGSAVLDKANLRLDVSNGWATFGSTLFSGSNSVTIQANGKLPESLDGFAGTAVSGWLSVSGNDLHQLAGGVTSGRVAGDGTFDLRDNTLRASLDMKASSVSTNDMDLSAAEVKAQITKLLPPADQSGTGAEAAPFDGLQTQLDVHLTDLQAGGYAVDSADIDVSSQEGVVRIENAAVRRAADVLSASGTYSLPRDMTSWISAPGSLDFSLNAPTIAAFNAEPNLTGPDGNVLASGVLTNGPDGYGGNITADVSELRMQDFAADGLKLNVSIVKSVATIDTLTFALNPTDGFSATGHVGLQAPYAYDGTVQARIRDLSKFNALVASLKGGLAGALNLNWQGSGDISTLRSAGNLQFSLTNGRVESVEGINAAIDGNYSPERINFPNINVTSSLGSVSAVIATGSDGLHVDQIAVKQGARPILSGSFSLPIDLRTPARIDTLIPSSGPISANLVSSNIALDGFFPKGQAPVTGTGNVSITASGSIEEPNAHVIFAGRGLQAKAVATLAPASLDADFTLLGAQLSLKARVNQPSFSPVDIAGTVPLPLKQILHEGRIDPQSPVQLSVRVPRSSLSIVSRLAPAIRYIQGTVAASVDVAGTIAKPLLSGAALLDLPAVRLNDPDMPSVNGFRADLRFAGNRLTLQQFGGNLSGGRFDVTGGLVFNELLNPVIDVHFISHGDLILRNEAVTVRADSDVRVTGPFAAASVAGDIGITKSRFFKQIDLLPLELPGRPPPKPPPMPSTTPSINIPPFRDWKFALKIHTKDPFIIQGNLANGAALIDLNLGGTGKAPTLDGSVRIENFVASLPFSKLNVTNGFIYFTKNDPFIANLNIQATSTLQDYNINVFIYGTAQDPKSVMSSEPPLPQEDIVSLLATGATTSNLNSGTGLAGRAAILMLQQLYHKVFKTKPAENESFASRFKVDVGGVDPRTGQQEVSSSFRLSDQLYLIGDVDVGGDLRGMVRYLLRFR